MAPTQEASKHTFASLDDPGCSGKLADPISAGIPGGASDEFGPVARPSPERLRPGRRLRRRATDREAPQGLGLAGPFADEVAGVRRDRPEAVDPA